jgi:hypothetical protein
MYLLFIFFPIDRWGNKGVGAGNEFKVAVFSVRRALPSVSIYLFTDAEVEDIDPGVRGMIKIIKVDLMTEAGLYDLLKTTKVGGG